MKSGRKIENRFLPDFFILNDVMKFFQLLNRYNDSLVKDVITKINGIDRSWGLHYNSLYAVESTL